MCTESQQGLFGDKYVHFPYHPVETNEIHRLVSLQDLYPVFFLYAPIRAWGIRMACHQNLSGQTARFLFFPLPLLPPHN